MPPSARTKSTSGWAKPCGDLVGRDAVLVEAAGLGPLLEDRHGVAEAGEGVGAGEARGPGAHDGDALAGRGGAREGLLAAVQQPVGGVALRAGRCWTGLPSCAVAHAGTLAQDLGRADAGAAAAQDVGLEDGERRTLDVVGLDAADEARDVDAGRAGLDAGRVVAEVAAAGVDQRPLAVERRVQLVEVAPVLLRPEASRPGRRPARPTLTSRLAGDRRTSLEP